MAYVIPTADDFKTRFPKFAGVNGDTINAAIAEAATQVDQTWTETGYNQAILYLTAHMLVMEGVDGAPGGATGGGVGPLKSRSIGDASESYGGASSGGGGYSTNEALRATSYGQSYLRLLRQNQPPIALI